MLEETYDHLFLAVNSFFTFGIAVIATYNGYRSRKNGQAITELHSCVDGLVETNIRNHAQNVVKLDTTEARLNSVDTSLKTVDARLAAIHENVLTIQSPENESETK